MPPPPAPTRAAAPFLRWAGGKRRLLPLLGAALPAEFGTYLEPFFGGGALLFDLAAKGRLGDGAVVNDLNPALATLYRTIRDAPAPLLAAAEALADDYRSADDPSTVYYRWRDRFNQLTADGGVDVDVAALMLLLNRTCFNGLWRVNGKGAFNVPWGRLRNPTLVDRDLLLAVHTQLQACDVLCDDYRRASSRAAAGDLVYFDPPYIPHSPTASFSKYTAGDFARHDHEQLAVEIGRLVEAGTHVMLSNADDIIGLARAIFGRPGGQEFCLLRVSVTRSISAKASSRGTVGEVLGVSWGPDQVPVAGLDVLAAAGVQAIPGGTLAGRWAEALGRHAAASRAG